MVSRCLFAAAPYVAANKRELQRGPCWYVSAIVFIYVVLSSLHCFPSWSVDRVRKRMGVLTSTVEQADVANRLQEGVAWNRVTPMSMYYGSCHVTPKDKQGQTSLSPHYHLRASNHCPHIQGCCNGTFEGLKGFVKARTYRGWDLSAKCCCVDMATLCL